MKKFKKSLTTMLSIFTIFISGMICGIGVTFLDELDMGISVTDYLYTKPEPTEIQCNFKKGDKVVYVTGGRDDYGGVVSKIEDGKVYIKWKIKFSYFLESYDNVYNISGIWMYLDLPEYMDCTNERLFVVEDSTW